MPTNTQVTKAGNDYTIQRNLQTLIQFSCMVAVGSTTLSLADGAILLTQDGDDDACLA